MAWTNPKTWATNEILTSPDLNTYVRDNLDWLANDHPRCRATRTSTQALSTGSDVLISLNGAETYDVGPMHDTGVNPSRLTVPAGGGGIYVVHAFFRTNAPGGTFTRAVTRLVKNGSDEIAVGITTPPSSSGIAAVVSGLIDLDDGDYVEMTVNQNSGSSVDLTSAAFAANWIAFL